MSLTAEEESNIRRLRLRNLLAAYPEPSVFGVCDCTSYSYFLMSIILMTLGTSITVSALGATEHYLFSNLGHMWLVGPISICCGTMVGIKSFLYLRRKNLIKMLIRQRNLLRGFEELTRESCTVPPPVRHGFLHQNRCAHLSASTLTLPPDYDLIVPQIPIEPPPPSYADALRQLENEKAQQSTTSQENAEEEADADKETV